MAFREDIWRTEDALLTFTLQEALSSVLGSQPKKFTAHGLTLQKQELHGSRSQLPLRPTHLFMLRTLWNVMASSNTDSMYISSTITWRLYLQVG